MGEFDPDDELDELRERRLEELRERATGRDASPTGGGTGQSPDEPVHVEGAEQFRELVGAHDLALVDFHADWCGPCKMLEPVVDELAAETDAAVLKVDVDAHQGLARDHQVQGVPTLLIYAHGEPVERVVGVTEKHDLAAKIEAAA